MSFDPWKWFSIALQIYQVIVAVASEPVGGPPVSAPAIFVTEGGSTFEVDISAKKIK